MATNQTSTKDLFLRSIAVLGLIAVLLLGAWGIIQIAVRLPAFFSSIGSTLSGAFSREEAPRATTTLTAPVVTPATTTPVKPTTATPTKPAAPQQPVASYTPSGNRTNLYGSPDLTVRVLSLNSLSSVQGRSIAQFEVSNVGTNVAPRNWSFIAELPIQGGYPYYSPGQQALYPGDRIVYTLTFDEGYGYGDDRYCAAIYPPPPGCGSYWGGGHFSVTVDPYNQVRESNDFNNTASAGY